MITRRRFLQTQAAGATFVTLCGPFHNLLARAADAAAAAERNDHVLLVIELSGGNDGLNTLVPVDDPLYYKNRPTIAVPKDQALKLADGFGLHPQLAPLAELFKEGKLSVVQGVGYPEPDRSHFRSMEIWHTASTDTKPVTSGWLGRFLDTTPAGEDQLAGLTLTSPVPQALMAERAVVPAVGQLAELAPDEGQGAVRSKLLRKMTAANGGAGPVGFMRKQAQAAYRAAERIRKAAANYTSSVEYPFTDLAGQLKQAAQIIAADLGVRVLYASQGGYDTHADQADAHSGLMTDLAGSLAAFQRDLVRLKLDGKVVTMVFSEFGRRVDENASRGTDHGAASCMFLAGTPVRGGISGKYPGLEKLGDGDLIYNTDFRSVYATLLDDWLGSPSKPLLGGVFPTLPLLAKTG